MTEQCDIAIIGAGAAGLAAGIFAGEAARAAGISPRIVILDGAKTIGAKILVSGGGRCNVTHDQIRPDDYFASSRNIVRNVLAAFNEQATVRWMESLGVPLKREETGKLFPVSDSARTVLAALLARLNELGVEVRSECRVTRVEEGEKEGEKDAGTRRHGDAGTGRASSETESVSSLAASPRLRVSASVPLPASPSPGVPASSPAPASSSPLSASPRLPVPASSPPTSSKTFTISHSQGELHAAQLILCAGGRSLPRTGSDGAGWSIVRKLGHAVTETWPALVPLVLDDKFFHAAVSGLSHEAELATFVEGKRIDRRTGSLLWTHFGISGPVAMDASRFWVIGNGKKLPTELKCNFLPGESFEQAEKSLVSLAAARPKLSIGKGVAERLPERLRVALIQWAGIDPSQPLGQLSRDGRRKLIHALTALPLPVVRERGWNYAEVTAGGVPLEEIDYRTMASRKVPGLFLAGEILDCDGRIGGFNFQWAWATGYLAGRAAVAEFRMV